MTSKAQLLQTPTAKEYAAIASDARERAWIGAEIDRLYRPDESEPGRYAKIYEALMLAALANIAKTMRADPRIDKFQALALFEEVLFSEIDRTCASVNWCAFDDYHSDGIVPIHELMLGPKQEDGSRAGAETLTEDVIEKARDRASRADTEAKRQARIREALNMEGE